jgi:hypothetical protein
MEFFLIHVFEVYLYANYLLSLVFVFIYLY